LSIAFFQTPSLSQDAGPSPFEIYIEVAPNILNIDSSGVTVTVHTDLAFSDVDDMIVSLTVAPKEELPVDPIPPVALSWSKMDNQGFFVVKFDISEVKNLVDQSGVTLPAEFVLTLTGQTTGGQAFIGTQNIMVIDRYSASLGAKFAVSFGPLGLYLHDGNAWMKIRSVGPQAMCSAGTDLYADFGKGVGLYKYSWAHKWQRINQKDPEEMVCVGNTLYVDFGESGLQKYEGGKWTLIRQYNVQNMWSYQNNLVVNIPSLGGLHEYNGNTHRWRKLNGSPAQAIIAVDFY
jgi:hypothetical protein